MKYSGIHILNILVPILLVLVGAYYLGALDSHLKPFVGFSGDWVCNSHGLDLRVGNGFKVYVLPDANQSVAQLDLVSDNYAKIVDNGRDSIFTKQPLIFRGYGDLSYIELPDKTIHYWCRRPRFLENFVRGFVK
jgi:hypothetical protein